MLGNNMASKYDNPTMIWTHIAQWSEHKVAIPPSCSDTGHGGTQKIKKIIQLHLSMISARKTTA